MPLQKLSYNVNKKSGRLMKKVIIALCVLSGISLLAIMISNTIRDNVKQVKLYSAQIDNSMSQKVSFIHTVASGVNSGAVDGDYAAYVDAMVKQYDDVSAVYVCVKEAGVVYSDGIMTYMSGGWIPDEDFVVSERSWYTGAMETDGVYVSEPYVDEQSGNICITLAKKVYKGNDVIGVAGMDMYMDDLVSLIEESYSGGDYVFLVSKEGTILTHPNKEIALSTEVNTGIQEALGGKYKKVFDNELKSKIIFDYSGGLKFAISNSSQVAGWKIIAVISVTWVIVSVIIILLLVAAFAIVFEKIMRKSLEKEITPLFAPLESLAANVSKISKGELDYNYNVDTQSKEVNSLSIALNDTIDVLRQYIKEISDMVTAISEKNLCYVIEGEFEGDYKKIKDSLINIMDMLNESLNGINTQAENVLMFSSDLKDTSEAVACSATSQSESVANASNEMKNLTRNMETIVDFAIAIKENTDNTNKCLTISNEEMKELVMAINDIAVCYDEIASFVSEINNIANQTNLLALNASIEAARAGEAGKGFAVVADEIGVLSNDSTVSSKKISDAISRSLSSVEKGKELVSRAEKSIADSTGYSKENTNMVNEIVNFMENQKISADEIFSSLSNISSMVENNAASAEENSAISSNLTECANDLRNTIAMFQLTK